jgi:hypothetical protein
VLVLAPSLAMYRVMVLYGARLDGLPLLGGFRSGELDVAERRGGYHLRRPRPLAAS